MKIGESKQKGGSSHPPLEEGTYPGVLVNVIDIGVQPQTDYKTGQDKAPARKLMLTFELPTEIITIDDEDKPRWMSKEYTFSFHEKAALTKVVAALSKDAKNPKNMEDLLGCGCMINVGHTATGNAKIAGIAPKMRGFQTADLVNPALCFDFDNPDIDVFSKLPQWVQDKVTSALNYSGSKLESMLNRDSSILVDTDDVEDFDDEIPY